jgi:hypothetical protein
MRKLEFKFEDSTISSLFQNLTDFLSAFLSRITRKIHLILQNGEISVLIIPHTIMYRLPLREETSWVFAVIISNTTFLSHLSCRHLPKEESWNF